MPNPLSHYGRAKYYGERFVNMYVAKHFCLRAGWMMGGGPRKDKKFINKLFQQIKAGSRELHVVDDKFGTPTYTVDFARSAAFLVTTPVYGVLANLAVLDSSVRQLPQRRCVTARSRSPIASAAVPSG